MIELTPDTALEYLRERGVLGQNREARIDPLAWGVSNVVFRITPEVGFPFVLKQSRTQLRTRDPWFSRLDRIWREVEVMQTLEPLLPRGVVPRVLFEDRDNYLFLMEAAPANHVVWKQRLLEGTAEPRVAEFLGTSLATIHRETALHPDLNERFGDREVFVQLRVDPFYRRVADVCAEVRGPIDSMIESMFATQACLVHADFSPKNVLIAGREIVLVDYETGHYGDPAFDLGFFLSHLLLKAILHRRQFEAYAGLTTAFWKNYADGVAPLAGEAPFAPGALVLHMVPHLAGCMWARIDGTSKVDYLQEARDHDTVREFCRNLFLDPPTDWPTLLHRLQSHLTP